jgi:putative transposase
MLCRFFLRGVPKYIRSDNGSEFTAKAIRKWLTDLKVTTLYIEPGSPWENRYNESFNDKLQDEILKREIFMTLKEAKISAEQWRYKYNYIRPHSSLEYPATGTGGKDASKSNSIGGNLLGCWPQELTRSMT